MNHQIRVIALSALALVAASPVNAQPAGNSAPLAILPVSTLPPARDIPYPGTIKLEVDATDLDHAVFRVREVIPVSAPGRLSLLLPEWIPGNHALRGNAERIVDLHFFGNGREIPWQRDSLDVFAYQLDVPAGVSEVEARFVRVTPLTTAQGRIVVTPEMSSLQWEQVSLYPAGYYTRRIPVSASVILPARWQAATALRPVAPAASAAGQPVRITFGEVSYETLQDSPVLAGRYLRRDDLGHGVALNSFAHDPKHLEAPAAVIGKYRAMVDQTVKTFGSRHFDHYDFLNSLSDQLGGIGLEHHRSTEISSDPKALIDYANLPGERNVFPHEFTHSWDGKFRRPADLFTPDFHVPMRDSLLWVYEGQTQFWGTVLEARSGMSGKQEIIDRLANTASYYDTLPGRSWRPLVDTTNDPIVQGRRPQPWGNLQRSEDYYSEGMLIWFEVDAILRDGTGGKRGIDDFARAFFGVRDGDWGELLYTRDDVIQTLAAIHPYDWAGFFRTRVDQVNPRAPLAGFTRSGYELRYTDTPNAALAQSLRDGGSADFANSLGFGVAKDKKLTSVRWNSPAFAAGLRPGDELIAVGDKAYSNDVLGTAITAAKDSRVNVAMTIKRDQSVRVLSIPYHGGLRYPQLVKTGKGDGALDKLLMPR